MNLDALIILPGIVAGGTTTVISFAYQCAKTKKISGPAIPGLPGDALALRGALENLLLIVPSRTLVIARTAVAPTADRKPPRFESELWKILEPS